RSHMTQASKGNALKPTAPTPPPGLTVVWTNAPQTNIGSYSITAAVSDPNYQGSSAGTFTITAPATPPTVSITSPSEGTVPSGPLTIHAAHVAGTNPVAHRGLLVNGAPEGANTCF